MRIALPALLALSLCGCATEVWDKPGATERDLQVSAARCRMGSASAYGNAPPARTAGDGLMEAGARIGYMRDCLIADGWTPSVR